MKGCRSIGNTVFVLQSANLKLTHRSYKNEEEVGSGLREFLSSNPSVKRSDIFITTKVWPHLCGSPEDVEWSLNYSLEKLGVDYVDSFLMHWPFAAERTDDYEVKIGDDGKV